MLLARNVSVSLSSLFNLSTVSPSKKCCIQIYPLELQAAPQIPCLPGVYVTVQ